MSQRAAQAARLFTPAARLAGVASTLVLAACAAPSAPPLPSLALDPDRIAVAGVSSGAYQATQVHLAFSDRLRGAVLVAGGPYGCAGGQLDTALGPCMKAEPFTPDPARLAGKVRERAEAGDLAPLAGLAGDRVLALHGRDDGTVAEGVSRASLGVYEQLVPQVPDLALRWDGAREFGHVMPTAASGVDCRAGGAPHLGACGFDAAGEALAWLYGPSAAPGVATGELRVFDQTPYVPAAGDPLLADRGWLYVPAACAAGETCGAVVVFHGCEQDIGRLGDRFARESGFNRWADVMRLVVLYPQARSSYLPLNPKACWDWWGYTGPDYDTRRGLQLRWLASAMAALGAPLE
ncbi:MAG TPA: PHB depolymerase family esterase [Arenimonas sp.]|uniref:extracellular catalytic domain type 2 short-chain-length polyhydroxyalkanoate depolymerase n=1 Tax=Arenimonas sp. TaxID=1872635 RepID=UPI002D8076E5|nr:PHB depolymerase family esterase [Arenimonas sp.]HEU0153665.1 PHB depolymerase family esterase [Arenimonas sp.]